MANPVNGKEYLFYVKTGAVPTNVDEVAEYTLVGLARNFTLSDSGDSIISSNKDNGARTTTFTGSQQYSISGECEFGHDGEAGQEIVIDAVITTTAADKALYWIVSTDVTSDIQFYGQVRAISYELGLPNDDIGLLSFSMEGIGTYTKADVD